MDPLLVGIAAFAVGAVVGLAVGRGMGRSAAVEQGRIAGRNEGRRLGLDEGRELGREQGEREALESAEARMQALVDAVKRGARLEGAEPDSVEARLQEALDQGWAPRETERQAALREAIGRVSAFLDARIREPLSSATDESSGAELRERIDRALGALQDLDFFISKSEDVRQGADLTKLAQATAREFAADHDVGVRLMLGSATVRAQVNPPALMDALYLILHNASRFGGVGTIDLTVEEDGDRGRIVVRDRGTGFSEEAFSRAFDPFYSTSEEGLGLGLPHARKVIEGMGGHIELRNVPDGGAEVEVSFTGS